MIISAQWNIVAIAAVVLLVSTVVWRMVHRRRTAAPLEPFPIEPIDVESLPAVGPSGDGPQLTCYGEPIRVAVLVVAPSGRGKTLPEGEALADVVDAAVPGLKDVLEFHAPKIERWPAQLSAQGFIQSFFTNVRLPGDHGKGTPWCGVAGRVEHQSNQYLLAVLCCAARTNSLGEIHVEYAGRWLDVMRIR